MPVIQEIVSADEDRRTIVRYQGVRNAVVAPTKKKMVIGFLSKMFEKGQNTVRPRKNSNVWALDARHDRIFKIGDSDKFYGYSSGPVQPPVAYKNEPYGFAKNSTKTKTKQKGTWKPIILNFVHYCERTTLHGLRYVGDQTLTVGERIFWLLAFLTAVGFAAYFINNIYEKFNLNPVIISFSPTASNIANIPFPAITICGVNIAKRSEGEKIRQFGTETEKMLLDDYCNSNDTPWIDADPEQTADWNTVKAFILKVTQSCPEMLKVCKWKMKEQDCNFVFNPILTDDGFCCTFNRLPSSTIFRNPKELNDLNETYPPIVYDWTPEKGYTNNVSLDALPWRSAGAGSHLGLTIVLDAQLDDYYCQTTSSIGFKVLLSNPIETPKMADYGFFVSPGVESRIVVRPNKIDSTWTLESIDLEKRQCYFPHERYLQFYRTYTERSCKLECQANRTLRACNCVSYFLPKNRTTRICGKKQDPCINRIKDMMEKSNLVSDCECLPACFEVNYLKTQTSAKLSLKARPKEDIIRNESIEYFVENMAVVHFFFNENTFTKRIKSELYGFSEFLSNTGGLLGLFLGFSFLSAVEIGYYLLVKTACQMYKTEHKKRKNNKNKESLNDGIVYPFIK